MPHSAPTTGSQAPAEKVLVVEDEVAIRAIIVEQLRRAGYRVLEAADGAAGLKMAEEELPALIIMDVNMPEMGGFTALEKMRARGLSVPVLLLSSQGETERRIKGLGVGADDFMAKPFDLRELFARVTALLRRGRDTRAMPRRLRRGDVTIDLVEKRAERAGGPLALTNMEFAILETLARAAGQPVSRERLLDAVWGYTTLPNTRTVETHIWRLRKKLGDGAGQTAWIQNRVGLGYVLVPPLVDDEGPGAVAAEALGACG